MPSGAHAIRIEIDHRTVETADRALHDLAGSNLTVETPLGAFSHLDDALDHLISQAEVQIGRPLTEMTRADKQQLVGYLDERGAFALRKAVERVAGVSRSESLHRLQLPRLGTRRVNTGEAARRASPGDHPGRLESTGLPMIL